MYLSQVNTMINTDQSFLITINNRYGSSIAQINSWENGLGLQPLKGKKSQFEFLDRERTLLNHVYDNDKTLPIHEFLKFIPDKYKESIVKQFAYQYSLLRMFRCVPATYDLYLSNRLLLCLIIYHQINLFDVSKLIRIPQHKIIERLYPNNKSILGYKSIVRLLKNRIIDNRKLRDIKRIDRFLTILVAGKLVCNNEKNLLQIKYIPVYVFKNICITHVFLLHNHLIFDPIRHVIDCTELEFNNEELRENKGRLINFIANVKDIIYMAQRNGVEDNIIKKRLYLAKNRYAFNQLHDEFLLKNEARSHQMNIPDISHIKPFLPGNKFIRPLRSYSEFINESDEMGHCLATSGYINSVNNRLSYIYSVVTENDRCTLELCIYEDGSYYKAQLQSYKNSSPKKETQELVDNWLEQYN